MSLNIRPTQEPGLVRLDYDLDVGLFRLKVRREPIASAPIVLNDEFHDQFFGVPRESIRVLLKLYFDPSQRLDLP